MLSGIGLRPSPYTHGMTLLLDEDALRALPKIALHDHLDGGLRPGTVLELAREAGVELPAEDQSGLATWFAETSDSGSLVEYANQGAQVSYEYVPALYASRIGDEVLICLVSLPKDCPPGDERGKVYSGTNMRTKGSWIMPDSQHMCGGE